jgi:hypothetical protein
LGVNTKGRKVTTCIAIEAEAPVGTGTRDRTGQSRLSPSGSLALKALRAAIAAAGERPPDSDGTRGVPSAVPIKLWRRYFRHTAGYGDDDKDKEAERKAWTRGRESALAVGSARIWGAFAWPAQ